MGDSRANRAATGMAHPCRKPSARQMMAEIRALDIRNMKPLDGVQWCQKHHYVLFLHLLLGRSFLDAGQILIEKWERCGSNGSACLSQLLICTSTKTQAALPKSEHCDSCPKILVRFAGSVSSR
jgi:hypothetical protein